MAAPEYPMRRVLLVQVLYDPLRPPNGIRAVRRYVRARHHPLDGLLGQDIQRARRQDRPGRIVEKGRPDGARDQVDDPDAERRELEPQVLGEAGGGRFGGVVHTLPRRGAGGQRRGRRVGDEPGAARRRQQQREEGARHAEHGPHVEVEQRPGLVHVDVGQRRGVVGAGVVDEGVERAARELPDGGRGRGDGLLRGDVQLDRLDARGLDMLQFGRVAG